MRDIYLDFNASTPVNPEVAEIMRHTLATGHGNPSSIRPSWRLGARVTWLPTASLAANLAPMAEV